MSVTKKEQRFGLGRGLGALLGDADVAISEREKIRTLPIGAILPNPRQPRTQFSPEALADLVSSLKEHGVLQPVLVRRIAGGQAETGESYQLVAGERRWRAAREAGLTEIPALVRELDDRQALEVAILENVQREDLNAVETARGFDRLIQEFGYSHQEVARRIGKSRITITNHLRLLRLPEEVLAEVEADRLSEGHARALLGLENPDLVMAANGEVQAKGMSVRETEKLVRQWNQHPPVGTAETPTSVRGGKRRRDPTLQRMEERLSEKLGTAVTITHQRGKGRIILEYPSLDDLERLMERLIRAS